MQIQIFLKKVDVTTEDAHETYDAILPVRGTSESAGVDVSTPYGFTLKAGETHFVDTGLIIKAPRGHCILILPRSSLATKRGITVANSPGLIDRDYCGPDDVIKVALVNNGTEDYEFQAGERVAQMLFVQYTAPDFLIEETPNFSGAASRGGFGSTGTGRTKAIV